MMAKHRIYTTSFAKVYPAYVAKAERKGRTRAEVDQIIGWLTGYRQAELEVQLSKGTDVETFFAEAPRLNPLRALITGVVCGVRVEDVDPDAARRELEGGHPGELDEGRLRGRVGRRCGSGREDIA